MSLAAQHECTTAALLAACEKRNRDKGHNDIGQEAGYFYAALEFRRALHLHVAGCAECLAAEAAEMERAA